MAWWDKIGQGRMVTRATLDLAGATTDLFTVLGGRVLLTNIVGTITTIIGGVANYFLQHDPTSALATTLPLCASTNIDGWDVGDILGITGIPTDNLIPATAGGAITSPTVPVVLTVGTIEAVCDLAPGGAVQWEIWYKPLDDAGYVVAA